MKGIICILPFLLLFASCKHDDVSNDDTTIEEFYQKDGPNQVSTVVVKNSRGAKEYKVFYPSNLADNTPLITWGNGSNVGPDEQEPILNHIATWGYIVVANYNPGNLGGTEIMGAVRYMLKQDANSKSEFYRKVDESSVGAVGGSQGGAGVVNAHTLQPDGHLLKTLVPVAYTRLLPNYPDKIRIPTFFISGTRDLIVSNYIQNKQSFDEIPKGVPAAMAMRKGAEHDQIVKSRDQWGYLIAWLNFQLKGDKRAEGAFRGENPELLSNENWEGAEVKNIP